MPSDGVGNCWLDGGPAHDLSRRRGETNSSDTVSALQERCWRGGIIGSHKHPRHFSEKRPHSLSEAGNLLVGSGALVLALGFPSPSAPIVLARLDPVRAVAPPRGPGAAAAVAQARRCTSRSRWWFPLRPHAVA